MIHKTQGRAGSRSFWGAIVGGPAPARAHDDDIACAFLRFRRFRQAGGGKNLWATATAKPADFPPGRPLRLRTAASNPLSALPRISLR